MHVHTHMPTRGEHMVMHARLTEQPRAQWVETDQARLAFALESLRAQGPPAARPHKCRVTPLPGVRGQPPHADVCPSV